MERIVVEMTWEVPDKCTYAQRVQLRNMIDTFMNDVAEELAWNEETFSIENEEKEVSNYERFRNEKGKAGTPSTNYR